MSIFWEKVLQFFVNWPKFFSSPVQKQNSFQFCDKNCGYKKGVTTNFFHLSLLLLFLDMGFEIRDPRWIKSMIQDKHPGFSTLLFTKHSVFSVSEVTNTLSIFFAKMDHNIS
jgi:hypothetical protein